MSRTIYKATEAWRLLNGLFCVYKTSNIKYYSLTQIIARNLERDLNQMEVRPNSEHVVIEGDFDNPVVTCRTNWADHVLVVGPRYQTKDFFFKGGEHLGRLSSGLLVLGLGENGNKLAEQLNESNLVKTFEIEGKLGMATDDMTENGMLIEKSSYKSVEWHKMNRLLSSIQRMHQSLTFKSAGVPLGSQEAYEMASKGLVRPLGRTQPLIYGLRCLKLQPPDFTLQLQCINETEEFLIRLIFEIGIKLRSAAVTSKIRCISHGPFNLSHTLLRKHWDLENIIQNMIMCKDLTNNFESILPQGVYLQKEPTILTKIEENYDYETI